MIMLPPTWCDARIGDVFDKIVDGSHNPPSGVATGLPMLSARNVLNNELDLTEIRRLAEQQFWEENRRTQASSGDVLLTIVGTIGRSYALGTFDGPLVFQRSVAVLHPVELSAKFCSYQFQSPHFQSQLEEKARGTAQKGVYLGTLSNLRLNVAPVEEQHRIVDEIEKQFTRLDAATAALKRVQANLKRYRASVLKAACEGRLVPTEAELARKEGRDYEPADKLLQRILRERRARWEADTLAKMQASGKPPKDNSWKQRYKVPSTPDTTNLPTLPEGWCWATVDQVGFVQLGRQRSPQNRSKDFPTKYIRAANITEKGLELGDILEMEFSPDERDRFKLHPGDIVLSEASGSPDQVGKPAVWNGQIPLCCFQNTIIRLKPISDPFMYLLTVFQSFYLNRVFASIAGGVGINHLGAEKFSTINIPLPPLREQQGISVEVDRRTSIIEGAKAQVQANLLRAGSLRSAVLQRAFTGQLVPQDPTDEPASVLLKRIRAERVLPTVGKPNRGRRKEGACA